MKLRRTRNILTLLCQAYGETIAGVMPHLGNEPKAFRIWLKKPQRGIGNTTPRELILAGKADDVEQAVTRMLSGEPS